MRKKKFPLVFLILFILVIFLVFISWDLLKLKQNRELLKIEKAPLLPKTPEITQCSAIDFPDYQLAKIDDKESEFRADLNGDQKEEIVRVYNQITETGFRTLPIMLKIFSGTKECPIEEFSFLAEDLAKEIKENEVSDFQIFPNFWGDERNVIMLIAEQTAYGTGSIRYIHFFAFENGKYQKIDGPELDSLSNFKFRDEKVKGREIIVARGIWAEGETHYDYHRYQFEIYTFDGQKYLIKKAGQTKNKYLGDIEEILKKEPEVLIREP